MSSDQDYKTLSFFLRGKRRRAVLEILEKPKTPKEIAETCNISISNVSNALAELVEAGFVECHNPEAHTFKFYGLAETGRAALKQVKHHLEKK